MCVGGVGGYTRQTWILKGDERKPRDMDRLKRAADNERQVDTEKERATQIDDEINTEGHGISRERWKEGGEMERDGEG